MEMQSATAEWLAAIKQFVAQRFSLSFPFFPIFLSSFVFPHLSVLFLLATVGRLERIPRFLPGSYAK